MPRLNGNQPQISGTVHQGCGLLDGRVKSGCPALRWDAIVVATNPFHQLRSRLVFQCACKQLLPPDAQPVVRHTPPACIPAAAPKA